MDGRRIRRLPALFLAAGHLGLPTWYATIFLVVSLLACTLVTLSPLSRRKAEERVSQLSPRTAPNTDEMSQLDPLDEAAQTAEAAEETA